MDCSIFEEFVTFVVLKLQFSNWAFVSGRIKDRYEPRHDKTNKMSLRPAKTQISLGVRIKKALVLSYPLNAQRRLIRLGGCPG